MFPEGAKQSLADIIANINEEERKQLFEDAERQARSEARTAAFLDTTSSVPPLPPPDPTILTANEQAQFQSALYEIASRKNEALKIFRPTPDQEAFFASHSPERLLIGGNRCLGAEVKIFDPVLEEEKEIGSIDSDFHVYALNHDAGEVVVARAMKPFVKGIDDLYEVKLDNGESFTCTLDHRIYTTEGYRSIRQIRSQLVRKQDEFVLPTISSEARETYVRNSRQKLEDSQDDYLHGSHLCDGLSRREGEVYQASEKRQGDAPLFCRHNPSSDGYELSFVCTHALLKIYPPSSSKLFLQRDEDFSEDQEASEPQRLLGRSRQNVRQFPFDTFHLNTFLLRHRYQFLNNLWHYASRFQEFLRLLKQKILSLQNILQSVHKSFCRRYTFAMPLFGQIIFFDHYVDEVLALPLLEQDETEQSSWERRVFVRCQKNSSFLRYKVSWPQKHQTPRNSSSALPCARVVSVKFVRRDLFYDLTVELYQNYFAKTIFHHNSGKTTAAIIEVARACCGCDPYGKYPARDGRIFLVGPNLKHLGIVYFKKIFRPGAFSVIRDLETNQWRTFFPNDPSDAARAHEARKCPPLIPSRFYRKKDVSWKLAGDEQPLSVRITKTGYVIDFFSFNSPPPMGVDVDFVLFDEECANAAWYSEMAARLLDRRKVNPLTGIVQSGKFVWSLTPQRATPTAFDLWKRAENYEENKDPESKIILPVTSFLLGLQGNPHVSDAAKAEFKEKFRDDPEQLEVRMEGHWSIYGSLVYGDFMPKGVHGCQSFAIPDDWTRYAIVDPGVQVCGVLFFAVPPPKSAYGGRKIVYDELYIKRCNAKIFAERFVAKVGQTPIQMGIIDHHAGRMPEVGSGYTVEEQYSRALQDLGFKFTNGGSHFQWSTDDVKAGVQRVKNALHIMDGRSELLVFHDRVSMMIKEAEHYANKKLPDGTITDDPIQKKNHLMDCLRYGITAELPYVRPVKKKREDWTERVLKERKEKARKQKQLETGFGESYNVG